MSCETHYRCKEIFSAKYNIGLDRESIPDTLHHPTKSFSIGDPAPVFNPKNIIELVHPVMSWAFRSVPLVKTYCLSLLIIN